MIAAGVIEDLASRSPCALGSDNLFTGVSGAVASVIVASRTVTYLAMAVMLKSASIDGAMIDVSKLESVSSFRVRESDTQYSYPNVGYSGMRPRHKELIRG